MAGFRYLAAAAILFIAVFELLRCVLLLRYRLLTVDIPSMTLLKSFFVGLRFDLAVTGYILAPAALIGLLPKIGLASSRITRRITVIYLTVMGSAAFMMTLADLEFFGAFNTRLNHLAVAWMETPEIVLQMIWEMYSVAPVLIGLIVLTGAFWLALSYLSRRMFRDRRQECLRHQLIIYPVALALIFLAIRGSVSYRSPLRWGMAYFSQHYFANQLALNSCWTFVRDMLDAELREREEALSVLLPPEEALAEVRRLLRVDSARILPGYDIARWEGKSDKAVGSMMKSDTVISDADKEIINPPLNVILILMESLTARFISSCGGEVNLAPEFDRLAEKGLLFPRFYSSGFHTFNGIFTVLTGFPNMLGHHSFLKRVESQQSFSGLPILLKERGYKCRFYVTSDPHFDNMQGFALTNGFDRVIGKGDYPSDAIISSFGVADEVMFDRALSDFNEYKEPFFGLLLTCSAHGPYIVPERPYPHTDPESPYADRFNAFSYADWAMGRFIDAATQTEWGRRTLFVLTGDTGVNWETGMELPLCFFHTPLLLFCPGVIEPGIDERIGAQKDILATVMNILGGEWINNTFSRSLLDDNRTGCAMFVEGRAYGYIKDGYYLMHSRSGETNLLDLNTLEPLRDKGNVAASMMLSARAFLTATHYMIATRKIGLPEVGHPVN